MTGVKRDKGTDAEKSGGADATAPAGLDAMLCFAIYGAAHAFTRAYKPLLEPLGLTYPQYLVMMALWDEDADADGQKVKTLGDRLGLDSGTLSPLLKRLELAGLVARKRDPQDERQVKISVTPQGLALKQQSAGVMEAIGRATGCSLDEVMALREALVGLKDRLETAQED